MTRIKDLNRKDSMNDNDILPVWDGSTASTRSISFANLRATGLVNINGPITRTTNRVAVSGNYSSAHARTAVTDTTAARTITILSADIAIIDKEFEIIDESGGAGTNNITIATQGAETISGQASVDITADYGGILLYSDGSNLFVR